MFSDKYNDFIEANRIEDAEDRLKTMKKLVLTEEASDQKLNVLYLISDLNFHAHLLPSSMTFQTTTSTL